MCFYYKFNSYMYSSSFSSTLRKPSFSCIFCDDSFCLLLEIIADAILFNGFRISGSAVPAVTWNVTLRRIRYFDIMLMIVETMFAAARIGEGCSFRVHSGFLLCFTYKMYVVDACIIAYNLHVVNAWRIVL